MENPNLKKLISQYLEGKTSEAENKLVERWLDNIAEENNSNLPNLDFVKLKAKQQFLSKIEKDPTSKQEKNKINWIWKVAAGLIPLFVITVLWLQFGNEEKWMESSTAFGEFKEIYLPDSSKVLLKPNSKIRYSSDFGKERLVDLEGNAFFDVRKNPNSPFTVQANSLDIKVLGTSFDIMSFKNITESKITVATGLVSVSNEEGELAVLEKADQLTYDNSTKSFLTSKSSSFDDLQFKQLVFEDESPKQISQILSNYYPISITCELDKDIKISATLNSSLAYEDIINVLNELLKNHQSSIVKTGKGSYLIK
ncbi:FecR domain-containing protein [Belliella sp. R4-6]|uniref:FecR domain-containing protein n=1 Tax=Belliella alkalica TaxID=1730871 RepID=A0ABS9VF49_9BACT|nr:FecR family protein [Belliella alkalica]MCH7415067.1 FecR domain-containing protein [Belliella alkalica]